jgi:glutaredoxin
MALKDKLLGAAKRTAGRASEQLFAGLNRADELGGDLRDYLLSRSDSPILRKVGERIARYGGVNLEGDGPSPHEQAIADAAAAAPPPTAEQESATEAKKGLGDPDIAAQIYGKESCAWTGRSITLLNTAQVDHEFIDLDDSDNRHLEGPLTADTKQTSVPYVYLRGEFVGGYNELNEVVRLGQLDYRILSAQDKVAADAVRKKVEIAPREHSGAPAPGELEEPPEARDPTS